MVADLIKKDQLDACMNRISKHIKKAISNIKTMTGATADSAGASGTVPQPAAGDHEKFLRGDGAWATPEGGGSSEIDYMFRQSNTQYSGGDIVFLSSPTGWFLVSENTGITANSALVIATPTDGDTITDGTVTWTLRKIGSSSGGGDGVSIGMIIPYGGGHTLPAGYLECNGAAVSRSMYPDLFSRIGTRYGAGDGTTTFNLPNYSFIGDTEAHVFGNGKNLAFTDGSILFGPRTSSTSAVAYTTSAYGKDVGTALTSGTGLTSGKVAGVATKALLGDTPENSGLTAELPTDTNTIYIIKAFNGQTEDSALIDITQYAQALANINLNKANVDLDNLSAAGMQVIMDLIPEGTGIIAQNLGTNGYVKFANGLIMQWGKANPAASTGTVTYNITFPNQVYTTIIAVGKNSGTGAGSVRLNNMSSTYTRSAFDFASFSGSSGSNADVITYVAFGR